MNVAYLAGMAATITIVAVAIIWLRSTPMERPPTALAASAALLTWGATLYLLVDPLPGWLQPASLGAWGTLSILVALQWIVCRPTQPPEPPAAPATMTDAQRMGNEPMTSQYQLPRINGQYKSTTRSRLVRNKWESRIKRP